MSYKLVHAVYTVSTPCAGGNLTRNMSTCYKYSYKDVPAVYFVSTPCAGGSLTRNMSTCYKHSCTHTRSHCMNQSADDKEIISGSIAKTRR